MSTTRHRTHVSSDPLLAAVHAGRDDEARVQVVTLIAVLDWSVAHVADAEEADRLGGDDTGVLIDPALHLGGSGCPVVSEYAALDLALSLGGSIGGSTDAGLTYLARALELRHRLPRLFKRVVALEVPLWKAFKVTDHTMSLPVEGAEHVDRVLTPFLHDCTWAQIDRTIDAARAEFDPAEAERRRLAAAETRHASIYLDDTGTTGVVDIRATLDLADALDLEHALRDGAQTLADLGSTETLDVRRSQALGEMARHQQTLDLDTGELTSGGGRGVTLFVHLAPDQATATLDNTHAPVLLEQVQQWCQTTGTKVMIKPVIDLATDPVTASYRPTDAIREHVVLRDRTCVFPGCCRTRVDLDHIIPFAHGGPTCPSNLAMLCRRHHRAKTHSRWTYETHAPGLYLWTSPTGATFRVDRRRRRP